MERHHRHLPHWEKPGAAYFVTWRLAGSLPTFPATSRFATDGAKYAWTDHLLDTATAGAKWLAYPEIACAVIESFLRGQADNEYALGHWVLLPNHVHMVVRPTDGLANVMRSLKSRSARQANELLGRSGRPFWDRDYFDRWIRDRVEEAKINRYIANNPVRAGLLQVSRRLAMVELQFKIRGSRRISRRCQLMR